MSFLTNIANSFFGKQPLQLIPLNSFGIPNPSSIFTAEAVVSEVYDKFSNVTTYPAERGGNITEHSSVVDFTISISGVTSDASMSYFNLLEDIASSSLGQLFGASSKSQGVWDQLNLWQDEGTPLQVKTKFAKDGFKDGLNITPFVIESLSIPRDKNVGSAIRYNMRLRRIRLVDIGSTFLAIGAISGIAQGAIGAASTASTAAASTGSSAAKVQTVDRGAQPLGGATVPKASAVDSQPTTFRTQEKLLNNRPAQIRLGFG